MDQALAAEFPPHHRVFPDWIDGAGDPDPRLAKTLDNGYTCLLVIGAAIMLYLPAVLLSCRALELSFSFELSGRFDGAAVQEIRL